MIDMLPKRINKFALIALAVWSGCALANPSGPTVVNGAATFSQPNANTLNVTNSRNAIINWQSFNIGQGQTTNFIQPSSSSTVMNRVISNNPSQIYGNLNSNGRVFLINQHGMMIGAGARINTAGFYGSTLNITNEDFLKGNLKFEGGGFGGIVNQGYIHAGPNGNVVLVAPDIENGGVIEVENGNVILAAGESIRITSLNDASIEFDVQSPDNGIINLGDIIAKQGAARLFAGNLQHSGSINANGIVQNADGSISLVAQADIEVTAGATLNADGDEGGSIRVQSHHGDLRFAGTASARGESHHGGNIQILGERVGLFGEARIDVSGKTGGGEILVGGDFQGQGDTQTARQTQVSRGTSLHADAIESGDGGKIIAWADDFTLFHGAASATGGEVSGDGGFIEISGKETLNFDGLVDTTAANGDTGTVLFDPRNLTVESPSVITPPELADDLFDFGEPTSSTDSSIDPQAITDITDLGNAIELRVNNNLTINDPILTDEGGGGGSITMIAGNSIFINADITTDGGFLFLTANEYAANGVFNGDRGLGAAEIRMADGVTLSTGLFGTGLCPCGNLEITMQLGDDKTNADVGDITLATIVANDILITHNGQDADNSILTTATGSITANSIFINHDDFDLGAGGARSIGTSALPLNIVADFIAAHIHGASTDGIYIDVVPNLQPDVTVGGTCYGDGDGGVNCGFGHSIKGMDTDFGDLRLNANGSGLLVIEPIDIEGLADITAVFDITTDADDKGNPLVIRGGTLNLTSTVGDILVNAGLGAGLSVALESTSNNLNINANDLVLTEGGTDSDAIVIVDNGTGALLLNGAPCATCASLAYDTRGDGGTDTGVIAANFSIAVTWDGGGDGFSWTDPLNWDTNNLPIGNADVTIDPVGAITIQLGSGVHDVFTLSMPTDDSLLMAGGALDIGSTSLINTDLTINGTTALLNAGNSMTINGALNLQQGTLDGVGDISVFGKTTWNPPAGSTPEAFALTGVGIVFANGGFDLGANLDNDTLTLDKFLVIGAVINNWNDAGFAGNTITGAGGIVNNGLIQAFNGAQLDINVPLTNNVEISKNAGGGVLQFTNGLIMSPDSGLTIFPGTVVNPGAPLVLSGAAELSGGGTLDGSVNSFGGIIDIEDGLGLPATLTITGSLFLDLASTLAIDLGGPGQGVEYDFLDVGGNVTLDGTLALFWSDIFAPGYTSTNGEFFDLIRSTTGISGAFDTIIDPAGVTSSVSSGVVSVPPDVFRYVTDTVAPGVIYWNVNADGFWDVRANWFWADRCHRCRSTTSSSTRTTATSSSRSRMRAPLPAWKRKTISPSAAPAP